MNNEKYGFLKGLDTIHTGDFQEVMVEISLREEAREYCINSDWTVWRWGTKGEPGQLILQPGIYAYKGEFDIIYILTQLNKNEYAWIPIQHLMDNPTPKISGDPSYLLWLRKEGVQHFKEQADFLLWASNEEEYTKKEKERVNNEKKAEEDIQRRREERCESLKKMFTQEQLNNIVELYNQADTETFVTIKNIDEIPLSTREVLLLGLRCTGNNNFKEETL